MARSLEARLARLEAAAAREWREALAEVAAVAAELGITPDALLAECEQFLSMPLAEQLAEVDRVAALGPGLDVDEIKATLTKHSRP